MVFLNYGLNNRGRACGPAHTCAGFGAKTWDKRKVSTIIPSIRIKALIALLIMYVQIDIPAMII